jgi:hypothetical protein
MKKMEYQMPEVKAYELNMRGQILEASGSAPSSGGELPGEGPDE